MAFKRIVADFETRSPVDIKDCGAYKYAQHPDTDVTMLAVLDIDNPSDVRMWIGPNFRHLYKTEVSDAELDEIVFNSTEFVAHNAPFERAIWQYVMVRKYGFTPLDVHKTVDTAVLCSMVGLPRTLEKASEFLNPAGLEKDKEGAKVMKRFIAPKLPVTAKRKKLCPENPDSIKEGYTRAMDILSIGAVPDFEYHYFLDWHEDKDDFVRMVEYCRRDVLAEYHIYKTLPSIDASEKAIWVLDQEINDRGIRIDIESARGITKTLNQYSEDLMKEVLELTDGAVTSMKAPTQIKKWLLSEGIEVDSVDKSSVDYLLTLDLKPKVRRFLEIRKTLGKSSVAKYDAMFKCASIEDNRVRGIHAFYGAGTGRWAGRLLQCQNLPRPSGKDNLVNPHEGDGDVDEQTINLAASGNPALPLIWYKDINVLAADCIRGMLVASEGKDFICSDFSAVEGRGLAYLAGEDSELEAYRSGKDIYKVNASLIYSIPYEQVDGGGKGAQRQVGKTATLACGYSGGYSALCRFGFDKMPLLEADAHHAISVMEGAMREDSIRDFTRMINPMSTDYEKTVLSAYENPSTRDMAESFIKEVRGTWIVKQWRKNHPMTTQLWNDMKQGSIIALQHKGAIITVRDNIAFCYKDRFLTMRLPSGRLLYYLDPRIEDVTTSWGSTQKVVTSMSVNSMTKQLERRQLNVSILVENLVQAFCRDLLKESMLRLDGHGYNIVAHIHDEILSEVPEGFGSVEEYESLMSKVPSWAEGMPLQAAGGYRSKRYRK